MTSHYTPHEQVLNFTSHGYCTPDDVMDYLQNNGLVSDNAVSLDDVAEIDLERMFQDWSIHQKKLILRRPKR